ncbi:hypothetical protein LTR10_006240 [Elasticomyces elasticus]|nr:hypothetical protein LTR10_006240 [Elasticomyces elasticus]KAK4966710.1 hypothetical protein LTR42_011021 [Elasticomyces elasticus]
MATSGDLSAESHDLEHAHHEHAQHEHGTPHEEHEHDHDHGDDGSISNLVRVYQAMDHSMMIAHREDNDEKRAEAERIAHLLLSYADLPLVFRARASMILGCGTTRGYVEWAKEAVHFAQLGIDQMGEQPGETELTLLRSCEEVRDKAVADFEELGGYEEDDEVEEVAAGEEESSLHGDSIGAGTAEPDKIEVDVDASTSAAPPRGVFYQSRVDDEEMLLTLEIEEQLLMPMTAPGQPRRKKKVRRIDSGYAENRIDRNAVEEFDKAAMDWVPLGMAADPAAEGEDLGPYA